MFFFKFCVRRSPTLKPKSHTKNRRYIDALWVPEEVEFLKYASGQGQRIFTGEVENAKFGLDFRAQKNLRAVALWTS